MTPDFIQELIGDDGQVYGPPLQSSIIKFILLCNAATGQSAADTLHNLLSVPHNIPIENGAGPGNDLPAYFIPGHINFPNIDPSTVLFTVPTFTFKRGPTPGCADVVVVCKTPEITSQMLEYYLSGEVGHVMRSALAEAGIPYFLDTAYVTGLVKHSVPGTLKQIFIKEASWLLWAELAIIRPKLVIALGSEPIKYFCGKSASVNSCRGMLQPHTITVGDEQISFNVLGTFSPNAVLRDPDLRSALAQDLLRGYKFVTNTLSAKAKLDYSELRTVEQVREYVTNSIQSGKQKFVIDCEWHGKNAYADFKLLTIQISDCSGHAVLIPVHKHARVTRDAIVESSIKKLRNSDLVAFHTDVIDNIGYRVPVGKHKFVTYSASLDTNAVEVLNVLIPHFASSEFEQVIAELKRLLERPNVSVGGHNFRADWHALANLGFDLTEQYINGFDTMIKHHMLYESQKQDLSTLTLKYTDIPRYDNGVNSWFDKLKSLSDEAVSGYGLIPEFELYPYAMTDVDATFRIDECLNKELDANQTFGSALRERIENDMLACIGIKEMEANGIYVDRDRLLKLAQMYTSKRDELFDDFKREIAWPEFNFRSVQHVKEFLYGEELNGKRDQYGNTIRLRPQGAVCCGLIPIKTTDKPAKDWARVVAANEEATHSPSTDKETLGILAEQTPFANKLRKIKFVDQVIKMFTSTPSVDESTGEIEESGLLSYIDPDNRIRTSIYQMTETGRWSSSKPNLQNIPKRRESELQSLFPADNKPPGIRSVFTATPGMVMIQADYKQAELLTLAVVSGDTKFWNTLTEKPIYQTLVDVTNNKIVGWLHPDYCRGFTVKDDDIIPAGVSIGEYVDHRSKWQQFTTTTPIKVTRTKWSRDLHAERAIAGFKMPYSGFLHGPPKGFVEATAEDKRVAAKTVNFGIPYGRGAAAISREVKQEGVLLAESDAQIMINGFLSEFYLVAYFLDKCKWAATNLGYVANALGRLRRFPKTDDRMLQVANEREASNFPIQSFVAECLNKATYNFYMTRRQLKAAGIDLPYRLLLGIHDAMMLEVAPQHVDAMLLPDGVIDCCMTTNAKVALPDRKICDGLYANVNPELFMPDGFGLETDKSLCIRWDEKPTADQLKALGVNERWWPKPKK